MDKNTMEQVPAITENVPMFGQNFNPMALMPVKFSEKLSMAGTLCKSGMLPASLNTPEKVAVALEMGHELQLSPMTALNNIAVVNGKPSLGADIMHAIVRRSAEYGGIKWLKQDETAAECVVIRKTSSYTEETRGFFSIEMARAAGLTGKDSWKHYPARMLKHRALSYALRDAFPDMLAGIYNPEEMETPMRDVTPMQDEPTVRDVTPATPAQTVENLAQQAQAQEPQQAQEVQEVQQPQAIEKTLSKNEKLEEITNVLTGSRDGIPFFTDEERELYRDVLRTKGIDHTYNEVRAALQVKLDYVNEKQKELDIY